jgi:hypothetical protein
MDLFYKFISKNISYPKLSSNGEKISFSSLSMPFTTLIDVWEKKN